jgi:hypothetical protein
VRRFHGATSDDGGPGVGKGGEEGSGEPGEGGAGDQIGRGG